jgi:glycosyltransferase involved in cell wall biosynthesis
MKDSRVRLQVVSFYRTDYQVTGRQNPVIRIEATGRFDLRGVWRLYRCIAEYGPDVIHIHHTVSAFWAALFGKMLGAKIVRSEHSNSQFHTALQRTVNGVSRLLSDRVLCNSKNTYKGLSDLQRKILGDRCRVVYNGVNAAQIERASSCSPPFKAEKTNEVVTVGSVGRLIDHKNYEHLLRAFSQVITTFEGDVRLILLGDGENRTRIEREISRLGLEDHVILTGEVEREKVYAALHAFDIFVMPSLSEGFCNAAVEAMAAGLPLLCSDIPTLREVAGEVALYADPVDPSRMAGSLIKLLREGREKWEERGRRAQQLAVEQYSIEKTAQGYLQSYLEM